ncbi:helix-turn-helix domain-containing protein [Corynebacterium kalidii]|uniref:Helix-turn-helix domain-containing protein n=1 Tax=Corynebacterium kalidii TaxID=2931982 RepID=A0A9X1WL31_9CORY|nr:helix-turn-helix domain-containing protein [Corynebacterium kalidii]
MTTSVGTTVETTTTHDFAQWTEVITRTFRGIRVSGPSADFTAEARHVHLGDVELFDMHTGPHTVGHPDVGAVVAGRPAGGEGRGVPMCKLSLQMEGSCLLSQDSRSCELRPGDLALYTGERAYSLEFPQRQRSLVVFFPRSYIHLRDDELAAITATAVSGDVGLGKVAVPLFRQLAGNLDELRGTHGQSLIRSSLDVLVTVLADHAQRTRHGDGPAAGEVAQSEVFRRAVGYIDSHLADPDLSPGSVARELYVSVRSLHAHFAEQHLTVASYIRSRRLSAIHSDLADPQLSGETVQSISARHGLFDASHVSKAFRSEYGESPRAYRSRLHR